MKPEVRFKFLIWFRVSRSQLASIHDLWNFTLSCFISNNIQLNEASSISEQYYRPFYSLKKKKRCVTVCIEKTVNNLFPTFLTCFCNSFIDYTTSMYTIKKDSIAGHMTHSEFNVMLKDLVCCTKLPQEKKETKSYLIYWITMS